MNRSTKEIILGIFSGILYIVTGLWGLLKFGFTAYWPAFVLGVGILFMSVFLKRTFFSKNTNCITPQKI